MYRLIYLMLLLVMFGCQKSEDLESLSKTEVIYSVQSPCCGNMRPISKYDLPDLAQPEGVSQHFFATNVNQFPLSDGDTLLIEYILSTDAYGCFSSCQGSPETPIHLITVQKK